MNVADVCWRQGELQRWLQTDLGITITSAPVSIFNFMKTPLICRDIFHGLVVLSRHAASSTKKWLSASSCFTTSFNPQVWHTAVKYPNCIGAVLYASLIYHLKQYTSLHWPVKVDQASEAAYNSGGAVPMNLPPFQAPIHPAPCPPSSSYPCPISPIPHLLPNCCIALPALLA